MFVRDTQIQEAVDVLRKGGVVVYPTETAYGFGADARSARAVERLMAIKGREGWKTPPLIMATEEMVHQEAVIGSVLMPYVQQFWPGPLTIVVPVRSDAQVCADVVRSGTIAVRVSSHPVAQVLSAQLGAPIVSTSANVAGQPTCFSVKEVQAQFRGRVLVPDFYVDAGILENGPLSTIIMEQAGEVVVLRPGACEIKPYVA